MIVPTCPNGHGGMEGDHFCPTCGQPLSHRCPLGHAVSLEDQFCRVCGASVAEDVPHPHPEGGPATGVPDPVEPTLPNRMRPVLLVAAIALAAALVGVGVGVLVESRTHTQPTKLASRSAKTTAAPTTSTSLAPSTTVPLTTTTPSPATTVAPTTTGTTLIGPTFADTYGRHGAALVINRDGTGTITFRTYNFCTTVNGVAPSPGPCDPMVGNSITNGGHASFRLRQTEPDGSTATGAITTSNDPQAYPVGSLSAVRISNDELVLTTGSGNQTFCGSGSGSTSDCGA